MSTDDHKQPDDRQLGELYRELPQPQPLPEVDQAILAAARKASRQKRSGSTRPRWYMPLSAAAVVMISVSLVVTMVFDEQALRPERQSQPTAVDEQMSMDDAPASISSSSAVEDTAPAMDTAPLMAPPAAPAPAQPMERKKARAAEPDSLMQFKSAVPARVMREQAAGAAESIEKEQSSSVDETIIRQQLEVLQSLYEQQRYERLAERLQGFRQRYPDYPLPDALAQWADRNLPPPAD